MNKFDGIEPDLTDQTCRLRILATSDLHMQLKSFDYARATANTGASLAKVASLIRASRETAKTEGDACLLDDNGDTWQGNPMADFLARENGSKPHPMASALNFLEYDALGIGNHDFDFGIDYLANCLSQLSASAICSNINTDLLPEISDTMLLERKVTCKNGIQEALRIGILSTAPDLTSIWNRHHLAGKIRFARPLPVLEEGAQRLRSRGADIVLVLAHMGFDLFDEGPQSQNELASVAALPEVDAVVGGHTHRRFPDTSEPSEQNIPASRGLVHGTPVVQPGVAGSDLGQITLTIRKDSRKSQWRVSDAASELIQVEADTPEDQGITGLVQTAHDNTCHYLEGYAARVAKPMNTFFALACPSPVQGLLAMAKRRVIQNAITGTELAGLPLLAVASATLTGGLDGPDNFISLKGGEIKYRYVAAMNPYANQVWAVRSTGAGLLDWLERSAMIFNTLSPDDPDRLLINKTIPGFRYDAVFGLSYEIDPSRSPCFDEAGRRIPGRKGRVSEVKWQGKPLDPKQEFLVATTDHRAGGGGIYKAFSDNDILVRGHAPLQKAVLKYLENPSCDEVRSAKPWRLKPDIGVSAILLTAPEAIDHFEDVTDLAPENCGLTDDGFLKVRLHL